MRSLSLRWIKPLLSRIGWGFLGFLVGCLLIVFLWSQGRPALSFWHNPTYANLAELSRLGDATWSEYLAHEDKQFEALQDLIDAQANKAGAPAEPWHRFNPYGLANKLSQELAGNRSYWLKPTSKPRFKALLIHGLSDSPYMLRNLAQRLHQQGGEVIGLRVPGHGLMPAQLINYRWEHARAAVELAAKGFSAGDDTPLYLVGFSNGGLLSVDYALRTLEVEGLPEPQGLVLIAPAMRVSALAGFAQVQRWMGYLPGLSNLAWVDIRPEYDPFKYNSFPVNAGQQIYELTREVQARLQALSRANKLTRFPSTLAMVSAVDATVAPESVYYDLLAQLPDKGHQLVVFDVNQSQLTRGLLLRQHESLLATLAQQSLPFHYTRVSNQVPESAEVVALTRAANDTHTVTEALGYRWPQDVYSLSHLALTVPAADPVYGEAAAIAASGGLQKMRLGTGGGMGEHGVFIVSMEQLSRLRSNPFYPYLEQRTLAFIVGQ